MTSPLGWIGAIAADACPLDDGRRGRSRTHLRLHSDESSRCPQNVAAIIVRRIGDLETFPQLGRQGRERFRSSSHGAMDNTNRRSSGSKQNVLITFDSSARRICATPWSGIATSLVSISSSPFQTELARRRKDSVAAASRST
jgi:hypothetical protein